MKNWARAVMDLSGQQHLYKSGLGDLHLTPRSSKTFLGALMAATGLRVMMLLTFMRPKTSLVWVHWFWAASAHPSCVKYHSSTYLKRQLQSLECIQKRGGVMRSLTIVFFLKSFIFGCLHSISFCLFSTSNSFCTCCWSSSFWAKHHSSSKILLSLEICWSHVQTHSSWYHVQVVFNNKRASSRVCPALTNSVCMGS